jgi:NAD-dependent deacetylase
MFGESLDTKKLSDAFRMAEDCDLCISVGSSLVVQPASLVVLRAWEKRKPLVIINIGETGYDEIATLKIDDDVEKVLVYSIFD